MLRITAAIVLCLFALIAPASAYDINQFKVQGNVFNVTVYKTEIYGQLVPLESYVNVAAFTSPWDAFTVQTVCPAGYAGCSDAADLLRCSPTEQYIQGPGDVPPSGFYLYSCPNTQVDNGRCVLITGKMYAAPGVIPPGTTDTLELQHLVVLGDGYCTPK